MARNTSSYADDCAFDFALEILSKKWNLNLILEFATVAGNVDSDDTLSFSEISTRIPEISPRMLSMRLTYLTKKNLIIQIENPEKPKKVRYRLSQEGLDLAIVLKQLREWSLKYGDCKNEICLSNECKHGIAIEKLIELEIANAL